MKFTPEIANRKKWYRTDVAPFNRSTTKVDRTKGTIEGVVLAQVGPARGHGTYAGQDFIDKIVERGKLYSKGVKVRFGHPNMSDETLGTFAGRAHNFRVEGDKAIADIVLSDTARYSPKGDMRTYLLEMASKESDVFGMSVVTAGNTLYQVNESNEIIAETDDQFDWVGYHEGAITTYEIFEELVASDFVDEGALTPDGLFSFSEFFNADKAAVKITKFFNENPDVVEILETKIPNIQDFISKYKSNQKNIPPMPNNKKSFMNRLKEFMKGESESEMFSIDFETSTNEKLRVITEDDHIHEGDEVMSVGADDQESPAADGVYEITTSDYAGNIIDVKEGKVKSVTKNPNTKNEGGGCSCGCGGACGKKDVGNAELLSKYSALEKKYQDMEAELVKLKGSSSTKHKPIGGSDIVDPSLGADDLSSEVIENFTAATTAQALKNLGFKN